MSARDADVLVVGAGIHGAAIARELVGRGRRAIVVEREAPAAGTSSRSSKLIHGGLRYLEHGAFALVRESLRERAALLRERPDLVHRAAFHIPVYADNRRPPWMVRAGLSLYALLGGLDGDARFRSLPRAEWPLADGLDAEGLRAVFRYTDAMTDDAALVRAVLAQARSGGAELRCPSAVTAVSLHADGARVALDGPAGAATLEVGAVVNAAGPWVARVQSRVEPALPPLEIELVRGAHLELPARRLAGVYYLESPRDRRPMFVIPRADHVLVGTTETPVDDAALDHIAPSAEEEAYLLEAVARRFPAWASDGGLEVRARWAGVRALPRDRNAVNARSRELRLQVDRPRRPRWISVVGGKLTTHAATARAVVDRLELDAAR